MPLNDAVNDPEVLEMLYWHEGLSIWQIAQRLDCSETTVYRRMRQYEIDRRAPGKNHRGEDYKKHAPYRVRRGYPQWTLNSEVDGISRVRVHQLLLIAKGVEPEQVFKDDMDVHHKNGIKWDNRPENLELVSDEEHGKIHAEKRGTEYYQEIGSMNGYTDEEIISWIDAFVEEFGVVPASNDLRGWPGPTPQTIRNVFGSFPAAIRAAGYEPRGDTKE